MLNIFHFLKENQVYGRFYKVDDFYPRLSQGGPLYRSIYYTAFTIIGFLKNKDHEDYSDFVFIIDDAKKYFEENPLGNDYEKSVVAYALALAEEDEHANQVIDSMGWKFLKTEKSKIRALQVEIASYALLACLKLGREENSTNAFNWLIKQRTPNGGLFSNHDTVLGYQALSAMSEHLDIQNPSIKIEFKGSRGSKFEDISSTATKFIQLPSTDRQFNVSAKGRGLVYTNLYAEYQLKTNIGSYIMTIKPVVIPSGLRLKLKIKQVSSNMQIIEVELPSGFEHSQHTVDEGVKVKYPQKKT